MWTWLAAFQRAEGSQPSFGGGTNTQDWGQLKGNYGEGRSWRHFQPKFIVKESACMVAINHWSEVRIRPLWEWTGPHQELKTLPPKMNLPKATVTVEEKEDPHGELLESGHQHLSCVCFCFCCSENSPVGEVIHLLRQIGLLSSCSSLCRRVYDIFGAHLAPPLTHSALDWCLFTLKLLSELKAVLSWVLTISFCCLNLRWHLEQPW